VHGTLYSEVFVAVGARSTYEGSKEKHNLLKSKKKKGTKTQKESELKERVVSLAVKKGRVKVSNVCFME